MLPIQTFDQRQGGNVLYKALSHPLAAEAGRAVAERLAARGPVALIDPRGLAEALFALHPWLAGVSELYVQDVREEGSERVGLVARPLSEIGRSEARTFLVASFDAARLIDWCQRMAPPGALFESLDALRLPQKLLSEPRTYLDRRNFATNFVFFRDTEESATRLVTTNYWAGYGGRDVRLWLRLFDESGQVLATWEESLPEGEDGVAGVTLDSREVRARFGLPPFTGQLFMHVVGAAGHDVVKYALDILPKGKGESLSATHDANAWPAERYAGLPAPRPGERVILWLQNSHAVAIPAGAVSLNRMGAENSVPVPHEIAPYATLPLDVSTLFPDLRWPAQLELRAGRHVVRPRYEVQRGRRWHIAHVNVERSDLSPDPVLPRLHPALGRGFLLPFPILPAKDFVTEVLPTPMAVSQRTLPLRLDLFTPEGKPLAQHFLGVLPRDHTTAISLDALLAAQGIAGDVLAEGGHGELVYDFRAGGEGDGWLHAIFRYRRRDSEHEAETSFGSHIFNTLMTYRDEPQSYTGPPPGLSTRLFLRLGEAPLRTFAVLIYPASAPWHPHSATQLLLHDERGRKLAEQRIAIPCSGSALIRPDRLFSAEVLARAGRGSYLIVRDPTCRLFGYHGLEDGMGRFSLDHMFGF
jgi:hypothetical protein